MHPVYRWGGSYPYHTNPTANDDPRAKEISSPIKMDPTSLSSPYQPWPYGGNYCYHGPQECHGGYSHGYFGHPYSFQPPYPYYPPPPPPPPPPPSPSPYHNGFYPPFPGAYPAYSIPPPHYSVEQPRYDYDKNAHGSHHCCGCNHREDEKKSRIEQKEPEIEKKTTDSLIPLVLKDYPYPIMWVPPGFMNTESKPKEKENPVPSGTLEPSKQGGNGETERNQQGGDEKRLPFPIFLFPSKNNEVGEKNVKESPFVRSDEKKRETKINDEAESDTGIKPLVQKVIPVKQLGTEEEKNRPKSIETKAKSASVEKTDNGNEGKASPKTPKLPPVCLRVDPLPRKKNTSRSPSPPGDKIRSKGSNVKESRSSQQGTQSSEGLKKSNEEKSKGNVKTIKVVESDTCENVSNGSEKGIVCKGGKKKLSENEAALIIQSASRGFQVRKSKPIMKLRQIDEVGKRVIELRKRVHDLESSCFDNKEKLVIGETIMSLLLKLDTIQGLHPMVREVRKCVAKELVGLQEKLDSLKSEPPIEEYTTKRVKDKADDGISETQLDTNVESAMINSKDDGGAESPNTILDQQTELPNGESSEEVNNKQPLSDDVIQDKLGGKDDNDDIIIHNKSETQSDRNEKLVESATINNEDDDTNVEPQMELQNEESSGEVSNELGGRDDEMEQKVVEENSKGQMSEQAVDAIQAESGTNVEPQSIEEVTKNQMEPDTAAESGTYVEPQNTKEATKNEMESDSTAEPGTYVEPRSTEGVTKNQMESDTAAECGIYVEPHSTEEVTKNQMESDPAAECGTNVEPQSTKEATKNQMESDTAAESGTNVEPQSIEEATKNHVESDTAAESGTHVEPQSTEEVTKNQVESDRAAESGTYGSTHNTEEATKNQVESDSAAECEEYNAGEASDLMNVKPQSTEEVTKNQVEVLSDEENVEGNVRSEEKPKEGDSVKAMEEVMKAQMDVIRELTAKVEDLEKKLLKNKNSKKMKKTNKGRKSRVCVVEEELT